MSTGLIQEHIWSDEVVVPVASTDTPLTAWRDVTAASGWSGFVENAAGDGQTLLVWAEMRWKTGTQAVPIEAINVTQFADQVPDGKRISFAVAIPQLRQVRLQARFSGVGGNAIVSDKHTYGG